MEFEILDSEILKWVLELIFLTNRINDFCGIKIITILKGVNLYIKYLGLELKHITYL